MITVAAVLGVVREAREKGYNHWWTAYHVACRILIAYLGTQWVDRNVMSLEAPTDFFQNDCATVDRQHIHTVRVVELAEMLLNLQAVRGFDTVLKKLHDDSVEAGFAELETGRLLAASRVPFRFIEATGVKGADYDLEIIYAGEVVCADTKCKMETTERGISTLVNSLRVARSQVPKDRPGVIFVKTPQTWNPDGRDDSLLKDFERASAALGSERIVAVYFYNSLTLNFGPHSVGAVIVKSFLNPRHKFRKDVAWDKILEGVTEPMPSWLNITEISK